MDIRDWWMFEYQQRSPFRDLFHWSLMPTVDAKPQNPQWINTFASADSVLTYSEFGASALENQCSKIEVVGIPSPAANEEHFTPFSNYKEKLAHKSKMGIDPDCTIIGMVGRNQRRKLFPDLMKHFRRYLDESSPLNNQINNLFLHCHTYYPDIGWEIPDLLNDFELSNRVLFTYRCVDCKDVSIDFFKDSICHCSKCGKFAKKLVGVRNPINTQELSDIYKMYDLYVQYANSEGFGMPQLEAAFCGIPVAAVDYSAMESVLHNIGGLAMKPLSYSMECETGCYRAVPSFHEFEKILDEYLVFHGEDGNLRLFEKGLEIHDLATSHYSWDRTAQIWIDHFRSIPIKPDEETWRSPVKIHQPRPLAECLQLQTLREQVNFLFEKVLYKPDWIGSFLWSKVIKDCTFGYRVKNSEEDYYFNESHVPSMDRYEDYSIEDAHKDFSALRGQWNDWETIRRQENARI